MFNFRIIDTENGMQIIDRTLQTPYDSIDSITMIEYIEVDNAMFAMDRMKKIEKKNKKRNSKWYRKIAMACGIL